MDVMVGTRPDITYAVSAISRFFFNPGKKNIDLISQVNSKVCICFGNDTPILVGYTNADQYN